MGCTYSKPPPYGSILGPDEITDVGVLKAYDVVELLGKGAYAAAFRARPKGSRELIVLKRQIEAFRCANDAQRTFREVTYQRQMCHPNIVGLLGTLRASNGRDLYLVLESMHMSLEGALKQRALLPSHAERIRKLFYQLLCALKYLHSGNLVHRDIKPANLLVSKGDILKVCDFGVSRRLPIDSVDDRPLLTQCMGSRWYRAPEVLVGSTEYTTASDLWQAGCVLGELSTGHVFFQGKGTQVTRSPLTVHYSLWLSVLGKGHTDDSLTTHCSLLTVAICSRERAHR